MHISEKNRDDLLAQGLSCQRAGDIKGAEACFHAVIEQHPQDFEALQMLGILDAISRNFEAAIQWFNRALAVDEHNASCLFNRANAFYEQGLMTKALADLELALALDPQNTVGLLTQGNVYFALQQSEKALMCFNKVLELEPTMAKALNNRGLALSALGQRTDALKSYALAIAHQPQYADAFNNLGILLMDLGHLEQSVQCFQAAIDLHPSSAQTHNNLGNAFNELQRYEDALLYFDAAIALKPNYAEAYSNRASALEGLMRLDEAIQSCKTALTFNDSLVMTHNKLAVFFKEQGKLTPALDHLNQALLLQPDFFDAEINRGNVLSLLKRFDESMACFDRVLCHQPQNELAQWNKSLLCLQLGDYATGWPLYEAGWAIAMRGFKRDFQAPLWLGNESIAGKTVLLHAEQGLGDILQFCRYARLVKNAGARVLLEVPQALLSLMQTLDGVDVCIEMGSALPSFDYHCPLMSLPLAFHTNLQTIPSPTAYLQADPHKVKRWASKLGASKRLKVGVVWNGGYRPFLPNVWWVNQRRNITLDLFASSLNQVEADFYSLQKGEPAESDIRGLEHHHWPQGNFFNWVDELQDFSDTAALIENLDVVVSVDTSTAHLAAALGKPTWILSRHDNCWRWLVDRNDSPWYASVKLYRQGADRDWLPTLARLADDLQGIAKSRQACRYVTL